MVHIIANTLLYLSYTHSVTVFCLDSVPPYLHQSFHLSLITAGTEKRQDGETSRLLIFQRECFNVPRLACSQGSMSSGPYVPLSTVLLKWLVTDDTDIRQRVLRSWLLFVDPTTMPVSDVTPHETYASNLRAWCLAPRRFWPLKLSLALQFFFWKELNALGWFEICPCKLSALPHSHSLVCHAY